MTPISLPATIAAAALVVAFAAGPAAAQQNPEPGNPGPLPGPIVHGKDIQPHGLDLPGGQTDPEADELLRQANDAGPVVPPHDLYGNPLGVNTQNIKNDPGRRTLPETPAGASAPPH